MATRMNSQAALEEARKRWPNSDDRHPFARRGWGDSGMRECAVGFDDVYSPTLIVIGRGKSWEAAFKDADTHAGDFAY
jgi:hypothetical protein